MYIQNENKLWIAKSGDEQICILPNMANRHGLVAGATGTGKTVTIKTMAETFSDMGVPVFLADIKGDVSGMCKPGETNEHVDKRVKELDIQGFAYKAYPVRFFDVFGKKGIPVRTTVSDMGPELLARILGLNDTQEGVLNIIFKIADDGGLLLLDLKDLRTMAQQVGDNADQFKTNYGNISVQSVGAIQRELLKLEGDGGDIFFGEPELDIKDWIQCDGNGNGYINLLNCVELVQKPLLYSVFLLWMLTDLYQVMPEVGDLDKPKMIFFFDEAHLLFNDAPKALLQKVEQVARLIRSKGVGVYFITQVPSDIPDSVLSQLGNKVQHALHAYTPKDQKAIRSAAQSFRAPEGMDCEKTIGELETGEALVSFLDEKGSPGEAKRAFILPPQSFMGVAEDSLVQGKIQGDPLFAKYGTVQDRESAYEKIEAAQEQAEKEAQEAEEAAKKADEEAAAKAEEEKKMKEEQEQVKMELEKQKLKEQEAELRERKLHGGKKKSGSSVISKVLTNTLSSVGRDVGKSVLRGLFGTRIK